MFKINDGKLNHVILIVSREYPSATRSDIESVIFGDWPNADEHQQWLRDAKAAEIAEWVSGIYVNLIEPGQGS